MSLHACNLHKKKLEIMGILTLFNSISFLPNITVATVFLKLGHIDHLIDSDAFGCR